MFGKIGNMPKATSDNDKLILEHFVVISYDQSSAGEMVKEAGSDIIAHNRDCLCQFCEILWNQITDVHQGSTLIMWR